MRRSRNVRIPHGPPTRRRPGRIPRVVGHHMPQPPRQTERPTENNGCSRGVGVDGGRGWRGLGGNLQLDGASAAIGELMTIRALITIWQSFLPAAPFQPSLVGRSSCSVCSLARSFGVLLLLLKQQQQQQQTAIDDDEAARQLFASKRKQRERTACRSNSTG